MFLYGNIKKKVYIKLPFYFNQPRKIYHLNKTLYSFKQALYIQFQILTNFLNCIRYKFLIAKPSIFINSIGFISIYINNYFIISLNTVNIKTLKTTFSKYFEITDFRFYKYYLGINIIRNHLTYTLYLYQGIYINKSLTKLFSLQRIISSLTCS